MDNRTRYRQLLEANGITQAKSAELIHAATGVPCSARTVRSWVGDPEKGSTRPCPDWAIKALERAIGYMRQLVAKRQQNS